MEANDIYLLAVNIVIGALTIWAIYKIFQWLVDGNEITSSISEETWRKVHENIQEVARKHEND